MAWIYLTVAGLFEIGWAIGLKYTDGFTRLLPSLWTLASMILSIVLLGLALRTLPVGTAYAVWTGIGAVGTAALGIYLFAEPATVARLLCIGLILSGIDVQPGSAGSIRWIIQFFPPVRNSTYRPATRLPWRSTMTSSSRHFSVV